MNEKKIVGVEIDEVDVEIIEKSLELYQELLSEALEDLIHEVNSGNDSVKKVSELTNIFVVRKYVIKLLRKINDATAN